MVDLPFSFISARILGTLNDRKAVFCWLMNREKEVLGSLNLQEDLLALDYVARKGISIDVIFDRANHKANIYDVLPGSDENLDDVEVMSQGMINMCFPRMPLGELGDEAKKLYAAFKYQKSNLILGMKDPVSNCTLEEIEFVERFSIENVSGFADKKFQEYLNLPVESGLTAEEAYTRDSKALYWLRVRTISIAALGLLDEFEDFVT